MTTPLAAVLTAGLAVSGLAVGGLALTPGVAHADDAAPPGAEPAPVVRTGRAEEPAPVAVADPGGPAETGSPDFIRSGRADDVVHALPVGLPPELQPGEPQPGEPEPSPEATPSSPGPASGSSSPGNSSSGSSSSGSSRSGSSASGSSASGGPTTSGSASTSPATPESPAGAAPVGGATQWIVQPGDSLWEVAADHLAAVTGRARADLDPAAIADYWGEVCAANRGRLMSGDLDLIFAGEVVALPPVATA